MEDAGRVLAVCVGAGGLPNHEVEWALASEHGVEGDRQRMRFHGGPDRAVCIFAAEDARALEALGVEPLAPGAVGENLRTEGLDYTRLSPGDRLAVGDDVLLEIFDVREPCATLQPLDARFPALMVGRSGFVCRVLRGGELRPRQEIRRVDPTLA